MVNHMQTILSGSSHTSDSKSAHYSLQRKSATGNGMGLTSGSTWEHFEQSKLNRFELIHRSSERRRPAAGGTNGTRNGAPCQALRLKAWKMQRVLREQTHATPAPCQTNQDWLQDYSFIIWFHSLIAFSTSNSMKLFNFLALAFQDTSAGGDEEIPVASQWLGPSENDANRKCKKQRRLRHNDMTLRIKFIQSRPSLSMASAKCMSGTQCGGYLKRATSMIRTLSVSSW